jgi:hypothetical protein
MTRTGYSSLVFFNERTFCIQRKYRGFVAPLPAGQIAAADSEFRAIGLMDAMA